MIGYLAWPRKRVSHLITTHPSTMTSIVKQIQASITSEAKLTYVSIREKAAEKQKGTNI
jgi:hypothetical protein